MIAARETTPLVAVYFSGTDVAQHITWRHMDPRTQQFPQDGTPDPSRAGVISAYYRLMDHFRLEILLQELGLMKEDGGGEVLAIDEMYRHHKRIWLDLAGVEKAGDVCRRLEALRTDEGQPIFGMVVNHTTEPATLYQVAPTLLYLLGLPQDGRMMGLAPERGGVLEEAITAQRLQRQPVRMISEYSGIDRNALLRTVTNRYDPDPNRAREMEKLRSLGFIQ